MDNFQNRTVGSFFSGNQDPSTMNYYGACVIFATWLVQKFNDVTQLDNLDIDYYNRIARASLLASDSVFKIWSTEFVRSENTGGNVTNQRRTA